jgi:hypothetical protein
METSILTLRLITYFLLGYSTYHLAAYSYLVQRYNRTNDSNDVEYWPVNTIFTNPIINLLSLVVHIYICYIIFKHEGFWVLIICMSVGIILQGILRRFFKGKAVYYSSWIFLVLASLLQVLKLTQ